MEINYNLQAMLPCPINSPDEIFVLSLDIRLAGCNFVGPITYWDAHVIKSKEVRVHSCSVQRAAHVAYYKDAPCSCDGLKVGLGNPRIPMFCQLCLSDIAFLELCKRPLVYDGGIGRVVEQAGCYPRLCGGGEYYEETP